MTQENEKKEAVDQSTETISSTIPQASFSFFLQTMGMQIGIALGQLVNPLTNKTDDNLDQAKYLIDILDILHTKTEGNLTDEEKSLFDSLLYQVQMGYVQKTSSQKGK